MKHDDDSGEMKYQKLDSYSAFEPFFRRSYNGKEGKEISNSKFEFNRKRQKSRNQIRGTKTFQEDK